MDRAEIWLEGPEGRVEIHESTAITKGTFVNTAGGRVVFEQHAFCGPWCMFLTGAHDYAKYGAERMHGAIFERNADIVLREGAWVCAGAIVVGPCEIGEHSVVSAGSVITGTVPAYSLVHGNPGHVVQDIRERAADPKPCPTCQRA